MGCETETPQELRSFIYIHHRLGVDVVELDEPSVEIHHRGFCQKVAKHVYIVG